MNVVVTKHEGVRSPSQRIGEILVRRRIVNRDTVDKALALQARSRQQLGNILLAQRATSGIAIAGALAEQWNLALADLVAQPPDGGLAYPERAGDYLAHRILPWRKAGGVVTYVTDRPETAVAALAAVSAEPGARVAVASTGQFDSAIGRTLGPVLASRAATRAAPAESVRNLGRVRLAAGFVIVATAAAVALGGIGGLASALMVLLVVNAATTALRLLALVAGFRRAGPRAESEEPAELPAVTLLVPLFREAGMVREIAGALAAIDYPSELLDVRLLLEAEDRETIAAVAESDLPGWVVPLIVPDGAPRTKPRALNYALDFARGEIVGILDAEDRPEPDQLRKVASALAAAPADVACAQCRLSYYNARENWITRCFQIEYSIWFDVLLTGFQRLGLPIPLGGTSVYFRRSALATLGAWDAHNVTEDADLGMRLARRGMRCIVLDSTTHEEANCRVGAWIRQRSRWLKGYLLTWLSHMRGPARLWRELGPRGFFGLNVLFLGAAATYLGIPLFWLAVLVGLIGGSPGWPGLLPGWAAWPLGISMGLGQAVMLGCASLAMIRRRSPRLLVWVPTLPVYWTLGALAAWKAVFEIAIAPYYWDKTRHGISRFFRHAERRSR